MLSRYLALNLPVSLQASAEKSILMRYMTDASLADMAPELRQKGIDCETCHMLMRNTKDSRIKIPDGEIVQFIRDAQGTITLIVDRKSTRLNSSHSSISYAVFCL